MKWPVGILAAGIILSACVAADDDAKADMRKMEGTWNVVSIEAGGQKMEGKGAPDKAVIKDDKATFFAEGKEIPTFKGLKLELDPKKKPKALDLARGDKDSLPCIYEVTEDKLKIAMPLVPKDRKPGEKLLRPESFDSKDKPFMVLIAKRSKE